MGTVRFSFVADTDLGTHRKTNQDGLLVKHAVYENMEVLLAIICDGVGGLSQGELASATAIRTFSRWFEEVLPFELEEFDMKIVRDKITLLIKDTNARLSEYGERTNEKLGTTFSSILLIGRHYLIHHVGDSRIYRIGSLIQQLTSDQTFVEREVSQGRLSREKAKSDKRRNFLLQCVGVSKTVEPQILCGDISAGDYLLCSDGFYHTISDAEVLKAFGQGQSRKKEFAKRNVRMLIDTAKRRGEADNISVIVVHADPDSEEK